LSKAHSFYTVRFEKLNNCGENAALLDGPPLRKYTSPQKFNDERIAAKSRGVK